MKQRVDPLREQQSEGARLDATIAGNLAQFGFRGRIAEWTNR